MASLLTNGISRFCPQPITEQPKLLKGSNFLPNSPAPRSPNSGNFKIRAADARATIEAPGKESSFSISNEEDPLQKFLKRDYKWGFNENIDSFALPKGLSEETTRLISSRKNEPDWMLEYRLKSYDKFVKMKEPKWSDNQYPEIDFQNICYYSEPKKKPTLNSLEEAEPELVRYFDKLGVPLNERNRLANVAVDAVLDSVSIATTHR